jgi:hypothetical protein
VLLEANQFCRRSEGEDYWLVRFKDLYELIVRLKAELNPPGEPR